jgi:hypothetical protein
VIQKQCQQGHVSESDGNDNDDEGLLVVADTMSEIDALTSPP